VTRRKLLMLDAARTLEDLRVPPNNKLEALRKERSGQHSIRVNDQFRLCFVWTDEGPANVEFVDYHLGAAAMTKLPPIHPGEVLREEFMIPLGLSSITVARAIGVPRTRIERLVKEDVDLTPDNALRLARYFGTSDEFWISIQSRYAMERAADALAETLGTITPLKLAS
jgi:addiction module HigA family antidote